ncbi:FKBP-type peptidyl-prolyl cis-trans isomerase [Microbacterium suaedae]|uniref:FKBP-type peptidyl-prolyl cis-trans isomerase n=1 Tax=Microbacterium suaedae TaxID=2067813 RepID=UPI0013A605DD|nr:FKBP-type peptidyl-prolyl cis-trans isomerase [Microbacterium suaedae]
MRQRSLAILSTAAVAALALAGCSSEGSPEDADESTNEAAVDLCDAAAPSGDAIDSVEVSGDFGSEAEATFDAPLEVSEVERKVVIEGSGDAIESGEYIRYAATVFDAESGDKLGTEGYEEGSTLPAAVEAENLFGQFLGCATPGTRVAFTYPGQTQEGAETASQIYVLDFFDTTPTAAWGDEQDAPEGLPIVDVADDGAPSVTLPDDFSAPEETEVATLKEGDGEVVEDGDTVFVQYLGVKGSDGSEFDSSWSRGAPTSFATDAVIPGFTKALVGQKVGSQSIAVIPAEEGYGSSEGHELQDETLVFVVDILATMHAAS